MGYQISTLPDFKSQGKGFLINSILEAKTIKLLTDFGSFNPAAKGLSTVQLMDRDVLIQDGAGCGFTPQGGTDLTQATLIVKPLKINEEYCDRDLERIWAVGDLKAGQEYDTMLFQADIADLTVKKAQMELEKMVWLGDTTLTGSTTAILNLKKIDGFVKQIKAGSYINLSGATGATVTAKLQKVYAQMPIEVSGSADFRIFIGQDLYNQYVAELAEKNLFNPTTESTLFGTVGKLEVVNGLNGGHVVAARMQSLQGGGEMTDVEYDAWYSKDDEVIKVKSRFSLGVVAVYIPSIGYTKFAA
jgi:hypothetical protein